MRKFISIMCAIILMSSLIIACTPKDTEDPDASKLTIYMARATGMVEGSREDEVRKAIQDKFFADTGTKISLEVKLYSDTELKQQVDNNWPKRSADIDAVVHYISEDSGSAIKNYASEMDTVYEVSELLEEHGQNILEKIRENDTDHLAERSGYMFMEDGTHQMNIIPSVNAEQGYAILVRKDYMREVQSQTGLDPEKYDVLNEGYENLSISEFVNLIDAMKGINGIRYPISGAAWDMNRVLGPAYNTDSYTVQKRDGKYVPAQFDANLGEFMDQLWTWARGGQWEPDSSNMNDSTRLSNFINGAAGVYISYPEVSNIIATARKLNAANPTAEYMVIAPLKDKNGNVNGYQKIQRAFTGLILPQKASTDSEAVVKYINWMYASKDNYELCKYGVKGIDWVEGEVRTINGKEYETWEYPAAKSEEYSNTPPYSGKFCLLPNINVSDRIRGDYSINEFEWYVRAVHEFPVYTSTEVEGVYLPDVPNALKATANTLEGNYVNDIRGVIWAGGGNTPPSTLLNNYVSLHLSQSKAYLDWMDKSIKDSLTFFNNKFEA